MAFLKDLMNLQLSCFNNVELEEMIQGYVIQHGVANETQSGTITHHFDENKHLHFFSYMEKANDFIDEELWRIDVHYDTGRENDTRVYLNNDFSAFTATPEDRFDTVLPVMWEMGGNMIPVLLESANKNDIRNVQLGEPLNANVNMYTFDLSVFPTLEDYLEKKKEAQLPEIGTFLPTGLMYSSMLSRENSERNVDFEGMLQTLSEKHHIVPFTFAQGIFKVKDFECVTLGGLSTVHDITVECEGQNLHVIAPSYFPALKQLAKDCYLDVAGMLTAMFVFQENNGSIYVENSNSSEMSVIN